MDHCELSASRLRRLAHKMTGYEQSPDYGDPPNWRGDLFLGLFIVMICAIAYFALLR